MLSVLESIKMFWPGQTLLLFFPPQWTNSPVLAEDLWALRATCGLHNMHNQSVAGSHRIRLWWLIAHRKVFSSVFHFLKTILSPITIFCASTAGSYIHCTVIWPFAGVTLSGHNNHLPNQTTPPQSYCRGYPICTMLSLWLWYLMWS